MARISRRQGPAASFELTAAEQVIPGMTISRYFDQGEILMAGNMRCENGTAITVQPRIGFLVDGVGVPISGARTNVAAGLQVHLQHVVLHPIDEGIHTINLTGLSNAAVGDICRDQTCLLIVIQLPQWDQALDFIDL